MLLADVGMDWPYTFMQLNDAISHAPLSNKGHVSTMTVFAPSAHAYCWLHQLQVCKLLQHKGKVVCLEGLNGELEALQFTFVGIPLWDAAAPSEPF